MSGIFQLSIFMSSLEYGCCGDAAVQYGWKTKVLVFAGHCILILCCFVFFFSKARAGRKESCCAGPKKSRCAAL